MVTVFVLHQQSLQRLGLRMLLSSRPGLTVVGETADEAEAIRTSDRLRPDVVLMDVRMERINGIDATRALTKRPNAPRVIILTTFDEQEYPTSIRARVLIQPYLRRS